MRDYGQAHRYDRAVASSIGRGVAGLVNGLDPHLVVVGGLGPELLHIAADAVTAAYHDGLMAFRAIPPPPIVPARLGWDAPLLGAADEAFALLLTDEGCRPGLPGSCESGMPDLAGRRLSRHAVPQPRTAAATARAAVSGRLASDGGRLPSRNQTHPANRAPSKPEERLDDGGDARAPQPRGRGGQHQIPAPRQRRPSASAVRPGEARMTPAGAVTQACPEAPAAG
jgi:hypothetical protein